MRRVLSKGFFHPDNVVPAPEFVTTAAKTASKGVAVGFVKSRTVPRHAAVPVRLRRDACVQIDNPLETKHGFKLFVEKPSESMVPLVHPEVDGRFNIPVVRGALLEPGSVGVSGYAPVLFGDEIGIPSSMDRMRL